MKEYTVSGFFANLCGFFFLIPVLLLYVVPYVLIWRDPGTGVTDGLLSCISQNTELIRRAIDVFWLIIPIIFAGIVLHELIHGIFMSAFAKGGRKSVSFGFNIKAVAPYAHCKEPLTPTAYRICLMMPAALLGDLPVLIAWLSGNILFLFFGILFSWAAAGDFLILWMSRRIETGMLQDHPDKIGFIHISE